MDFAMKMLMLVLAHYVGDYGLQTDWMAANKGRDWYVAFAHSCVWSFMMTMTGMLIGLHVSPLAVILVLVVPHMLLDHVKAAGDLWAGHVSPTAALAIDQSAHMAQLVAFALLCS